MNAAADRLYSREGTHGSVVHAIGLAIVTGQHEPGTAIPTEERLSIQFGVGRSAIREAIRVLSGKGLVKATVGRGTIVQPQSQWHLLDPDVLVWKYEDSTSTTAIEDLTGLRLMLEPTAARIAATNVSGHILDPIEQALDRMKTAVDDTDAFVQADLDFHAAIVAATNNQLLMHLNSSMSVALLAQRRLHTVSKTRHKRTLPSHRRVLDAIRDQDPDNAEVRAREIVEHAHQDLLFYTGRSRRSGAS